MSKNYPELSDVFLIQDYRTIPTMFLNNGEHFIIIYLILFRKALKKHFTKDSLRIQFYRLHY